MKTKFYFVRHAQSVAKKKNIVQGAGLGIPLSKLGSEQALKLAEKLRNENFDLIFASKAIRAIATADQIRKFFPNVPYQELPELNERSKGDGEGMAKEEFGKKYPKIIAAWAKEEDPRLPGGESFADVEKRVMPVIESHLKQFAGKKLLYICHGNLIRVILGNFLGAPVNLRNRIQQDYCAVNIAEYDSEKNRWLVQTVNQRIL